jgi:hypothetical protein
MAAGKTFGYIKRKDIESIIDIVKEVCAMVE